MHPALRARHSLHSPHSLQWCRVHGSILPCLSMSRGRSEGLKMHSDGQPALTARHSSRSPLKLQLASKLACPQRVAALGITLPDRVRHQRR